MRMPVRSSVKVVDGVLLLISALWSYHLFVTTVLLPCRRLWDTLEFRPAIGYTNSSRRPPEVRFPTNNSRPPSHIPIRARRSPFFLPLELELVQTIMGETIANCRIGRRGERTAIADDYAVAVSPRSGVGTGVGEEGDWADARRSMDMTFGVRAGVEEMYLGGCAGGGCH